MSNKAKKAKQAKLRKQQQVKQLNRVRGQVKNFNLTDEEAAFYQRALTNKDTPIEFVESVSTDLINLLGNFNLIKDIAVEEDLMAIMGQAFPELAKSVTSANEYLIETTTEIKTLKEKYQLEFAGMDNSDNSYLISSPAMDEFSAIQEEIGENAVNLVTTMKQIIAMYADIDAKFPGEENDNTEA